LRDSSSEIFLESIAKLFLLNGAYFLGVSALKIPSVGRLKDAATGVPKEVRKAVQDNTEYLRPMPGSARMYPETDVSIVIPNKNTELPELITDVHQKYLKLNLSEDLARMMSRSKERDYFENLIEQFPKVDPSFIAELLTNKKKELKSRFNLDPNIITRDKLESIIGNLNEDMISKEAAFEIMIEFAKGKDITIVAAGPVVYEALVAAKELLAKFKISAEVINCASIKPLDVKTIVASVPAVAVIVELFDSKVHPEIVTLSATV